MFHASPIVRSRGSSPRAYAPFLWPQGVMAFPCILARLVGYQTAVLSVFTMLENTRHATHCWLRAFCSRWRPLSRLCGCNDTLNLNPASFELVA